MSNYSRQNYREIATLLRKSKASAKEISRWCKKFKADNPRFKSKTFRSWIKKGKWSNMPCKSKRKYSRSKKLGYGSKPILRKKQPKNSIKTGETKHFKFYTKGNKNYCVSKVK